MLKRSSTSTPVKTNLCHNIAKHGVYNGNHGSRKMPELITFQGKLHDNRLTSTVLRQGLRRYIIKDVGLLEALFHEVKLSSL